MNDFESDGASTSHESSIPISLCASIHIDVMLAFAHARIRGRCVCVFRVCGVYAYSHRILAFSNAPCALSRALCAHSHTSFVWNSSPFRVSMLSCDTCAHIASQALTYNADARIYEETMRTNTALCVYIQYIIIPLGSLIK